MTTVRDPETVIEYIHPEPAAPISAVVRAEVKGCSCSHLQAWPTKKQIQAGISICPYCALASLASYVKSLESEIKLVTQERAAVLEREERANAKNVQLQQFCIENLTTAEQAAALFKINEAG